MAVCYCGRELSSQTLTTVHGEKPQTTIYMFSTGDSFNNHHCFLYQKVGWSSLKSLFVTKLLLHKFPTYLTSLLKYKNMRSQTRLQGWLTLEVPRISTFIFKCTSFMEPTTKYITIGCSGPFGSSYRGM